MAPKRGRNSSSTPSTKRVKKESSGVSSVTPPPAVQEDAVAFNIKYPIMNPSKTAKESKQNAIWRMQAEDNISPFQGFNAPEKELDYHYTVVPNDKWMGMRKYNNFIIQSETYKSNETVYVKGKTEAGIEPKDFWVARVLQVKASSPQHVYALIAWMYWPEELAATAKAADEVSPAGGRRKYHGSAELIANILEYEHVCDNEACKTLYHSGCLVEETLTKRYYEEYPENGTEPATNGKTKDKKKNIKSNRKVYSKKFKGSLYPEMMSMLHR
ncbi:hypothetical protein EYC84_002629 [Monilinia fructicola]|uniref:BAH domain-containing protein n=1 Tax=Monilinia fructicola TaxID=38448 RepID=A0A5M9JNP4_MONFR|nr:hypothetical protein EYC84_002629 [Monilinia fructicola]